MCNITSWPLIPACDCEYPGKDKVQINKKQYDLVLSSLKNEGQNIVDGYKIAIKKESDKNGW